MEYDLNNPNYISYSNNNSNNSNNSKLCSLVYMHKKLGRLQAIEGGMPIEAMVDLTGGLAERWQSALSSLTHRSATFFSSLDVEL